MNRHWLHPQNLHSVPSPGLLVDANRVTENLNTMISMVGGDTTRLRPHVKTHKMPDVIRLQVDAGITQFKTATISEARMTAESGGLDVLLAYQPVGPNVERLMQLIESYPNTSFATVADDASVVASLAAAHRTSNNPLRVFIDVDCGMHRTGIPLGDQMDRLRAEIESHDKLAYAGLHVYDGHLHQPSADDRRQAAGEIIDRIGQYDQTNPSPCIVGGGSPTFAHWASETDWQCSPGTPLFWDCGYGTAYPDLKFSPAIALLTRVISKPGDRRLCLDLGYKAVASEMPLERRVVIPEIEDAVLIGHSEEHLVIETKHAADFSLGQALLAIPRHVCPTVALHAAATVVRDQQVTGERWAVTARDR